MICKGECGEDKELNDINFIPNKQMKNGYLSRCRECQNLLRIENKTKYFYYYKIDVEGVIKEGRIKSKTKTNARKVLRFRFPSGIIMALYTNKRFNK